MPIELSDYDPNWPSAFEQERERLSQVVDGTIEHIGSTSIPSLAAKPIIDILIGVHHLEERDQEYIQQICSAGYIYVPEGEVIFPERRLFSKPVAEGAERTHQIHMVEMNGPFWARHLLFRDYLRAHPETRKEYEALKRELAPHYSNTSDYGAAKTPFIRSIEAKAQRELG